MLQRGLGHAEASDPAARDKVVTLPGDTSGRVAMGYLRLSPFSQRARQAVREIYQDLARSAPFDGLLFHDDVTLSDYEDASSFALRTYQEWGLPPSIQEIRKSDDLLGRWAQSRSSPPPTGRGSSASTS